MKWLGASAHQDFGFPGDIAQIAAHHGPVWKGRYVDEPRLRASEQLGQLIVTFGVHRSVAGDRFHEEKPVFLTEIQHDVWHFSVLVDRDAEIREALLLEVSYLVSRIAHIDDLGPGRKPRGE